MGSPQFCGCQKKMWRCTQLCLRKMQITSSTAAVVQRFPPHSIGSRGTTSANSTWHIFFNQWRRTILPKLFHTSRGHPDMNVETYVHSLSRPFVAGIVLGTAIASLFLYKMFFSNAHASINYLEVFLRSTDLPYFVHF